MDTPPDTGDANGGVIPGVWCDRIVGQTGIPCDFPDGLYCQSCIFTPCWDWIALKGGLTPDSDKVCSALTGTEKKKCFEVFNCMADDFFSCAAEAGAYRCYCSDATCSAGANGECAEQVHAFLDTTNPADVLRQLNDPTTAIARLIAEARAGWPRTEIAQPHCPRRGIKINEIDYDQPGPDSKEFIELYNDGGRTWSWSSDFTLNLIDYTGPTIYRTLHLGPLRLPPGGYLVVGTPAVQVPPGVAKVDLPAETDVIHNGPGGVCGAVYWGLPEGTLWDPSNLDLPNPVPCGLVQGPEPATLVDSDTSAGSLCAMPHVNCTAFDCAPTFDLWSVCATPTPGAKNVR